jgi:LPXTG-motif cell wall-anchored protein
MSSTIMLRVVAGVLAAIVLAVIVFRRKKTK